jgi:hypothetical protein
MIPKSQNFEKATRTKMANALKMTIFAIIRYFLALIQAMLRAIQTEFIF